MCITQTNAAKKVEDILREHNAYGITFHQIEQHSPIAGIRGAIKLFEEGGCDGIVSVGGGSCVDAAKTLLYIYQQDKGGRTPYQIAIPTTLSAAEYQVSLLTLSVRTLDINVGLQGWRWIYKRRRSQGRR